MRRTVILGLAVLLSGCQTSHLFEKDVVVDNATFMQLWGVYNHCRTAQDLDTMTSDANRLEQAVQNTPSVKDLAPVPRPIERFVADPVNRLSVDLKAMTASCRLYAGQSALAAGRNDIATDMFRAVIAENSEPTYGYYVAQAKAGMQEVEFRLQLASARPAPKKS
jgi:hypothetical protein